MKKKKILIVEDDVLVGENLKDNLEDLGYVVAGICTTGEEAVEKVKEIRPDLILLDIKLEGEMDGVEANKEIQKYFNVPVVYLTAYAEEKTFPDLKDTAPYGVINKSARIENIRSAIEVALYKFEMEMAQKRANDAALEAKAAAEKANQAKTKFRSHTSQEIRGPTTFKTAADVMDKKIGPLRILLADDSEDNRELLTKLLRINVPHDIKCACNGEEVIKLLKQEPFDLILMDITMPVMDGIEAARYIRNSQTNELNSRIPIIAMTGNTSKESRECYLEVGMNDYISKPFHTNELFSVIQRVVQNRIDTEIKESGQEEKEALIDANITDKPVQ